MGRRRDVIGEARFVVLVRGVEVVTDGFCCDVEGWDRTEGCGDVEPNRLEPDAKTRSLDTFVYSCQELHVPDGVIAGSWMMETGGVFLLDARSAKGLSSSMKGEPLNGDTFPNPVDEDP